MRKLGGTFFMVHPVQFSVRLNSQTAHAVVGIPLAERGATYRKLSNSGTPSIGGTVPLIERRSAGRATQPETCSRTLWARCFVEFWRLIHFFWNFDD